MLITVEGNHDRTVYDPAGQYAAQVAMLDYRRGLLFRQDGKSGSTSPSHAHLSHHAFDSLLWLWLDLAYCSAGPKSLERLNDLANDLPCAR